MGQNGGKRSVGGPADKEHLVQLAESGPSHRAPWAVVRAVGFSHQQDSSSSLKLPLHRFRWFTWSCTLVPNGPSPTPGDCIG